MQLKGSGKDWHSVSITAVMTSGARHGMQDPIPSGLLGYKHGICNVCTLWPGTFIR